MVWLQENIWAMVWILINTINFYVYTYNFQPQEWDEVNLWDGQTKEGLRKSSCSKKLKFNA